ncbi:MAG: hypothetical protein HY613_09140 [Candidatus Rokubacteria bacterium]|nr:hypothetical protein [Candidatus Rokubacteria bacterium]
MRPVRDRRQDNALTVGIHLSPETEIGTGLFIAHFGGIWINPRAPIGAPSAVRGAPALGDRVWIGSGAVIGANSLVTCNLPEDAVAVGVPARVLSYTGSANLLRLTRTDSGEAAG